MEKRIRYLLKLFVFVSVLVCRARGRLHDGTFSSAVLLSASGLGVVAAGGVVVAFTASELVVAITSLLFVNEFTLFFFSENKNIPN